MGYMPSVFSLMFFSSVFIYLYWGTFIILKDQKETLNRVFLLVCILLSIWSFAMGMSNAAADVRTAIYWKRVTAIGWGSVYSAILHFILLLTNRNWDIRSKRLFLLLYVPAAFNIYIFAVSEKIAAIHNNLIKIRYGWTNIAPNNIYDVYFNIYYISFVLLGIMILLRWKERLRNKRTTMQANLIIGSMTLTLLLGSFTDRVANIFLNMSLPRMAPLFILFPVWALYHSARRYDVFKTADLLNKEIIVSADEQKNIFVRLAAAVSASGILAFAANYFQISVEGKGDIRTAILRAALLISIGAALYIIQKIKREKLKEIMTTMTLLISIPAVTLQFLDYASITVWVFPILIIMSSLLFTKRTLLIWSTAIAVITQRMVWILRPDTYITIDKYDYILRMMIFLIIFMLGSYINRIYVAKIRENDYQIRFQKMNADISLDFLNISDEKFNDTVNNMLSHIGQFFEGEITYIFLLDHDNETMECSSQWTKEQISSGFGTGEKLSFKDFSYWRKQLRVNKAVFINDVDNLPQNAYEEKNYLIKRNVKSAVLVPIPGDKKIQGFIAIETVISKRHWTDDDIKRLSIIGNLIASGLMKIKADSEIQSMAYTDSLTKLPNRFSFSDKVSRAILKTQETGALLSVIFIDLDGFKAVNDTIGHSGGDRLLSAVAASLEHKISKFGLAARFGGDEFMIMLDNVHDHSQIAEIADSIIGIFSDIFTINEQDFSVTASAGISVFPRDGTSADILIKNADIAMYKAKDKGKNQYAFCSQDMKDEVQMQSILSADLYNALERDELIVHYQPQVNLYTNEITGAEALIRWNHPKRGIISPSVFIPIAEKNGMINSIGKWVLRTACMQNKTWQDNGYFPINMSVNISIIQFMDANIADTIENILIETGLEPRYLELEVTESIAIKDNSYSVETLTRLRDIGLSIAIDDFGTKYSSLSRLKILPIDRIKIDKQFIDGVETQEKDRAVTMTIINLAKNLGLDVIAEGVETQIQLDFLKKNMCSHVQGYYYYKPMPSELMQQMLSQKIEERV